MEDGIYDLYRVGELNPFEEVGSDLEEQMRALPQFASSEEYPLFEVIGGGRIFSKEIEFDEIYNQELFNKIKEIEEFAKGGNLGEFNEAIVTDLYDKINGKKIRTQNQKSLKEAIESANENSKYYNGYAEVYIGAIFVGFSKNGHFKYSSRYKGDKYAGGGSTDLEYSDILNVLKSKIENI